MKEHCSIVAILFVASVARADLAGWQAAVAADNPRNWYRFDETAGTTLVDHGSGALDGQYQGVEINQTGLFGPAQAANFPGLPTSNDLVRFPDPAWQSATIAGDWTAEFIVKKSASGLGYSQAFFNGPATSLRLEQWNSLAQYGDYRGGVTQYGVADYYLEGTDAPVDEWTHMVFVRSGNQTFIYQKGILFGSMPNVVNLQMQTISRSMTTEWDKLHALLDEAVIYNRALPADRIAAHFAQTGLVPPVVAPTITAQPQGQQVVIGTPDAIVTFDVGAIGTLPLVYQWQKDGVDLDGATSDTLVLTGVSFDDEGTYSVSVSNEGGADVSDPAPLEIVAPALDQGPNQTVLPENPVTFSVTLPDVPGYAFQWKKNGGNLPGATAHTLILDAVAAADSGVFTLDIVYAGQTRSTEPSRLVVPPLRNQSYEQTIVADGPVAYWRLGDTAGSIYFDDVLGRYLGTFGSLAGSQVELGQPGAIMGDPDTAAGFLGIVDSKGEVLSEDALNTPAFTAEFWALRLGGENTYTSPLTHRDLNDDIVPPYRKGWTFYATDANNWQFRTGDGTDTWNIIDGPAVRDGEWTHLVGTHDGGTAMRFYVDGALAGSMEGAYVPIDFNELPSALLRIAGGSTEDPDGGFFFIGLIDEVVLYDKALSAEQVAAHWAAGFDPAMPPQIQRQPQSQEVVGGAPAVFSVGVKSAVPVTYQWKKDGADLPGETSDSLTLPSAQLGDAGEYSVVVTSKNGSVTSAPATFAVVNPEATYVETVLRDGPVAYWRLGETAGATAVDSVGGHDGMYMNGVLLGQPGALLGDADAAAGFVQTQQTKVEVPWSAQLNTPEFSFEIWAKLTGGIDFRSPMTCRGDLPQEGYIFYATPEAVWNYWTGSAAGWQSVAGPSIELGSWYHLAGTYDGTTKRFYVNGQEAGSAVAAVVPNDGDVLRIGAGATEAEPGNYFFEGVLDEAAVYDKALSGARILTHYLAGMAAPETVTLDIRLDAGQVVLTWEGGGALQQSANPGDGWTDVAGAASPYRVTPTEGHQFFRLRQP